MTEPDTPDLVDQIMAYETGQMNDEQAVAFFQDLLNTGAIWQLQGSYQRTALALIEAGYITRRKE